jgi:hypothetical protein
VNFFLIIIFCLFSVTEGELFKDEFLNATSQGVGVCIT